MNGIVFFEFKKFIDSKYGARVWLNVLEAADLEEKIYFPDQYYPDEEFVSIAHAASIKTGINLDLLLESFREFFGLDLLKIFDLPQPKLNV
jgi:hypothetical protein